MDAMLNKRPRDLKSEIYSDLKHSDLDKLELDQITENQNSADILPIDYDQFDEIHFNSTSVHVDTYGKRAVDAADGLSTKFVEAPAYSEAYSKRVEEASGFSETYTTRSVDPAHHTYSEREDISSQEPQESKKIKYIPNELFVNSTFELTLEELHIQDLEELPFQKDKLQVQSVDFLSAQSPEDLLAVERPLLTNSIEIVEILDDQSDSDSKASQVDRLKPPIISDKSKVTSSSAKSEDFSTMLHWLAEDLDEDDDEDCLIPKLQDFSQSVTDPSNKITTSADPYTDFSNEFDDKIIRPLVSLPRRSTTNISAKTSSTHESHGLSNTFNGYLYNFNHNILSDPISQSSSSPIKNTDTNQLPPLQPFYTSESIIESLEEEPALKKRKNARAPKITTITDSSGFLYTPKQLREANKATRKKEELIAEMTVYFPTHIYGTHFKDEDVRAIMGGMTVKKFECELPVIFWTRGVSARYEKSSDTFIPCPSTTILEKTIALFYQAHQLVQKLYDKTIAIDIKNSIEFMKRKKNLKYNVIIIIEGYDKYLRKLKNKENNKFRDEVLKRLNEQTTKRKIDNSLISLSKKEVEELINKSQIHEEVNFFPVKSNYEVIEWLLSFTYTISSALYDKWERNRSLGNLAKVKTGVDTKSTYINSITNFKAMTAPKAERLYGFYSSFYSLYQVYKDRGSLGKDEHGRNIVPPLVDQALARTFLSDDPEEIVRK